MLSQHWHNSNTQARTHIQNAGVWQKRRNNSEMITSHHVCKHVSSFSSIKCRSLRCVGFILFYFASLLLQSQINGGKLSYLSPFHPSTLFFLPFFKKKIIINYQRASLFMFHWQIVNNISVCSDWLKFIYNIFKFNVRKSRTCLKEWHNKQCFVIRYLLFLANQWNIYSNIEKSANLTAQSKLFSVVAVGEIRTYQNQDDWMNRWWVAQRT